MQKNIIGQSQVLLYIAKGKKGRAAALRLSAVKSGARKAQTAKVEQNLIKYQKWSKKKWLEPEVEQI